MEGPKHLLADTLTVVVDRLGLTRRHDRSPGHHSTVRNTVPSPPVAIDSLSFEPVTPTAFLDRAAAAHGDRIAVVDGYRGGPTHELHERCPGPPADSLGSPAGDR